MQRRHQLLAVLLPLFALLGVSLPPGQAAAAPAPTVSAVKPNTGPLTGGNRVTILGRNFTSAPTVKFGALRASHVTVVSRSKLVVTAPKRAAGSAPLSLDVRVTTTAGTSGRVGADRFSFLAAPTIAVVAPAAGSPAGGSRVVLTGARFQNATAVTFDGVAGASLHRSSATQVEVTAPPHTAGVATVELVTPQGTATSTFTYALPAVSGLSPAHGSMRGGTVVTISGSGFSGATGVTFDGTNAADFTVDSDSTITATSPPHGVAEPIEVQVTVAGGQSTTGPAAEFTYGIIDFTIPAGTGAGPWNTSADPVRGQVGDTVRFHNADSAPHRLHSNGHPGAHWAVDLAPGGSLDWPLVATSVLGDLNYDHLYSADARFYVVVDPAS